MTDLFGVDTKLLKKEKDRTKRNWLNRFQRWCDKKQKDETTSEGKCGYGMICDYCKGSELKKPCVKALNNFLKEKKIKIDYNTTDFDDVWYSF